MLALEIVRARGQRVCLSRSSGLHESEQFRCIVAVVCFILVITVGTRR